MGSEVDEGAGGRGGGRRRKHRRDSEETMDGRHPLIVKLMLVPCRSRVSPRSPQPDLEKQVFSREAFPQAGLY